MLVVSLDLVCGNPHQADQYLLPHKINLGLGV
jgi:hypothetical protein